MDDLKNTFTNIKDTITKTSSGLIKNTKLNMELMNEEDSLKATYIEIGKKVHEIYNYGGSLGEYFDIKYKEILEIEKNIKGLKDDINIVKGVRICPNCGKQVDKNNEFCSYCGSSMLGAEEFKKEENLEEIIKDKIIEEKTIKKPQIHEEKTEENYRICSICGEKNEKSSRFCLGCGRILN